MGGCLVVCRVFILLCFGFGIILLLIRLVLELCFCSERIMIVFVSGDYLARLDPRCPWFSCSVDCILCRIVECCSGVWSLGWRRFVWWGFISFSGGWVIKKSTWEVCCWIFTVVCCLKWVGRRSWFFSCVWLHSIFYQRDFTWKNSFLWVCYNS